MKTREELEARVAELERQVAASGRPIRALRGIRSRASWSIGPLPFYDIALGPDIEHGELRGHARGFIAIGDMATGVIALGGFARGALALGGFAIGLVAAGGLSIGALLAAGGLAIGGLTFGGGAVGGVAIGGGAAGVYSCGGGAVGEYVMAPNRRDPEAQAFFDDLGLTMCGTAYTPGRRRRY